MSIWSDDNHIQRPWFDYRIKKRKRSLREHEQLTSSDESEAGEGRFAKRVRCNTLEQGLADLSLLSRSSDPIGSDVERGPMIVEIARGEDKVGGGMDESTVLPSSVEEPAYDIPEVEMKTSSWYEIDPHRIVITDLDSFESEDDNVGSTDESSGMTVNANLLKYLKDKPPLVPHNLSGSPAANQALVLFRPLPIPDGILDASEEKARDVEAMDERARDVEAMEIES